MGLLNSVGKFFAPAFASVLLNIVVIGSAVGLCCVAPSLGFHPVYALAVGAPLGSAARLAIQAPR